MDYMQLGISIFELAQRDRQIYENMTSQADKNELLNFVFLNLKIKDGKITPSLNNGFDVIASRAIDGNWLPSRDSNPNKRDQNPLSYH